MTRRRRDDDESDGAEPLEAPPPALDHGIAKIVRREAGAWYARLA